MKRSLLPAMLIFLTLILVSGCGQLLVAIGGADAVLTQAEGALEKEKGISFKGKGKNTISEGQTGMSIELDLEGTYRFVMKPYRVHIEETFQGFGELHSQEFYMTDKEGYEQIEGGQWQKITIDEEDMIHKYDPRIALRFLHEAGDHTKMEEKDGMYVLEADLSGDQAKELMEDYYKEILDEMKQNLAADGLTGDLKFSRIKYQIWIDSQTFVPEKYHLIQELKGNVDGDTLEVIQDLTFSKDGKVEEITIPDEVKDKAH